MKKTGRNNFKRKKIPITSQSVSKSVKSVDLKLQNPQKQPSGKKKGKPDEKKMFSISWGDFFWEYSKAIFFAILLAMLIRSFVIQAFHIPSGSMIPTFLEGDRVLVSKFSYGIRNPFNNEIIIQTGAPTRGDVVIFKFPENTEVDFVKRVIGLPGETIEIKDGKIFIDGFFVFDPHGHYNKDYYTHSRDFGPYKIPENEYFMMGDNRDYSNDSRVWGSVDISLLRGKAWILYWSWDPRNGLSFWKRLRFDRLGMKIL
jgi:signal peptidase I